MAALRELSARVGLEPLLVQASNGNTSIKEDGTLWIKASGRWLANATREELFLGVDLAVAQEALHTGAAIVPLPAKRNTSKFNLSDDLRPSIETPMHAAIPHRVVIHVHSINAISWAIRLDGPAQVQDRLAGLHWQWIPYAASGNPLAREIAKAAARAPETNVFILGSHGLVVCGPDCDSAEKLLREVDWRLAVPPRKFAKPDLESLNAIARFPGWQFPEVQYLHALATDPGCRSILQGGVLYPCQATFLGQTTPFLPARIAQTKFAEWLAAQDTVPPFVAIEGVGVMVNDKMTSAERATLRALAEVALRTADSAPLRYLNSAEVADVLHQGAHGAAAAVRDVPDNIDVTDVIDVIDVMVAKQKPIARPHAINVPASYPMARPAIPSLTTRPPLAPLARALTGPAHPGSSYSGAHMLTHPLLQSLRHSVRHSMTYSLTYSLTHSVAHPITTITRLDMGRRSLDGLNACAAWLGSHSRKLRSRIASARIGLGA
jgi:rhamnose utilization protein RhaD (predicted bifunctional aldolase and dehydrogenase)